MSYLYHRTYPIFSIGIIEAGKCIEKMDGWFILIAFALQIVIGTLTICKLYRELFSNKNKNKN